LAHGCLVYALFFRYHLEKRQQHLIKKTALAWTSWKEGPSCVTYWWERGLPVSVSGVLGQKAKQQTPTLQATVGQFKISVRARCSGSHL
jgi:hypothetical protein